jgi:hypothetical protein
VIHNSDGSVTIETNGVGVDYPNCLDPRFLACAA